SCCNCSGGISIIVRMVRKRYQMCDNDDATAGQPGQAVSGEGCEDRQSRCRAATKKARPVWGGTGISEVGDGYSAARLACEAAVKIARISALSTLSQAAR